MVAAMQSEEESEEIADQFLRKELGVEAFLSAYLEKRIVSIRSGGGGGSLFCFFSPRAK